MTTINTIKWIGNLLTMSKNEREIRLGELIKALGLVKKTQLAATLRRAVQAGLPLGRALVMSGYLTEDELSVTLEMQALLRADEITLAEATQAFSLTSSEGISLAEAFKRLGVVKAAEARSLDMKLGSLLVDADHVAPCQLEDAQNKSIISGLALTQMLTATGVLSPLILEKAQELQNMIREGMVTHAEAVKILKASKDRKGVSEFSNGSESLGRKKIRLAELLLLSKVVSENDLANAIEIAFKSRSTIGEILIDMGLILQETLTLAFELQRYISAGSLDPAAAAETLHYVATTSDTSPSLERAGADLTEGNIRLGELLSMCGLVNSKDIDDALSLNHQRSSVIGEVLVLTGVIGQATLIAALRCQALLRRGLLQLEDGVKALQYSNEHHIGFDDALEIMGRSPPAGVSPNAGLPGS